MDTPANRDVPMHVHWGPGLHAAVGRPVDASSYYQYLARWSRLFVPAVVAAAEVTGGGRVLDVATRPGEAAQVALSVVGRSGRVVGADLSLAMLQAAHARLSRGSFQPVAMDGQALAFQSGSFDAVLCQLGLMFFPDAAQGLAEFRHRSDRSAESARDAMDIGSVPCSMKGECGILCKTYDWRCHPDREVRTPGRASHSMRADRASLSAGAVDRPVAQNQGIRAFA